MITLSSRNCGIIRNKFSSIHRQKVRPFLYTRPKYRTDIYKHGLDWDDGLRFHDSIEYNYNKRDLDYYTYEPYMLCFDSEKPRQLSSIFN